MKFIPYKIIEHLESLQEIALKSAGDAVEFYKNGARNVMFDLEAISRILAFSIDKGKYSSYRKLFKRAEDILGAYDYHAAMFEELAANKESDPEITSYFKKNSEISKNEMITLLTKEKWIGNSDLIYKKLIDQFANETFPSAEKLRKDLAKYIIKQLKKVESGFNDGSLDVNDIENGLHEIRRKLRWVSMYAQVADGWITLRISKTVSTEYKKYMTEEVLNSRFNKLPEAKVDIKPLIIDAENFYALSWIISELGILKDQALTVMLVNNAIKNINIKDEMQINKIRNNYTAQASAINEISTKAKEILTKFFTEDKIAERIISNIESSI